MLTVRVSPCWFAHGHRRAEEYLVDVVSVAASHRIDDLGVVEPLDQEADAPIDFAQALLAVDVVAVLGAVAVARRPGDRRDDLGPLLVDELRSARSLSRANPPGVM